MRVKHLLQWSLLPIETKKGDDNDKWEGYLQELINDAKKKKKLKFWRGIENDDAKISNLSVDDIINKIEAEPHLSVCDIIKKLEAEIRRKELIQFIDVKKRHIQQLKKKIEKLKLKGKTRLKMLFSLLRCQHSIVDLIIEKFGRKILN